MNNTIHSELEKKILFEISNNPSISQTTLSKKLKTAKSNIQRKLIQLGYKKINGKYVFIGTDFSELEFNALKYLIALSPIKITDSFKTNCDSIMSGEKLTTYTITLQINDEHKSSIYLLLNKLDLVTPISTSIGYNCMTFTFNSEESFNIFNLVIDKISNPSNALLFYNRDMFFSQINSSKDKL